MRESFRFDADSLICYYCQWSLIDQIFVLSVVRGGWEWWTYAGIIYRYEIRITNVNVVSCEHINETWIVCLNQRGSDTVCVYGGGNHTVNESRHVIPVAAITPQPPFMKRWSITSATSTIPPVSLCSLVWSSSCRVILSIHERTIIIICLIGCFKWVPLKA